MEDGEGNVWVATFDGLDRFRELAIPRISVAEGLLASLVFSVQASPDGSTWVGTQAGLANGRAAVSSLLTPVKAPSTIGTAVSENILGAAQEK